MSFDAPAKLPEWEERFARFRIAAKLHEDDGEIQVASLIYAMDRKAEHMLFVSPLSCNHIFLPTFWDIIFTYTCL